MYFESFSKKFIKSSSIPTNPPNFERNEILKDFKKIERNKYSLILKLSNKGIDFSIPSLKLLNKGKI